jgi:hypothetical protein
VPAPATARSPSPNRILICAAAWAVPGLGHLWLGRRKGLIFLVVLMTMFALGLLLHGRIFPIEPAEPFVALMALAKM